MTRCLALFLAIGTFLVPVSVQSAADATPDHFRPQPGVTFNNPTGDRDKRRTIYRKIMRSINSAPAGSKIRIFTWNFLTSEGTDALLRAQRRGVTVRLLMDAGNNSDDIGNPPFRRLRAGLHHRNQERPKRPKSWAKTCQNSCRGKGGAAHAKFFMFSRVGKVPRVVIQGSANLTLASTNNQWNDVVTHTRSKPVWRFYDRVFQQAARDRKAKSPFASGHFGDFSLYMFPQTGRNVPDPVLRLLNKVKCRGATNTASGRTIIRLAPDVIRNARGMKLARKIKDLWNAGCDIKIGYTVVGIDIGRFLRSQDGRGPVPMKHLVQDFDGDGQFDNYFHLKAMAIVGNVARDRSNKVVLNGSANWSGLAKVSDENVGIYWRPKLTDKYREHIEYWYVNFPEDRDPDGVNNEVPDDGTTTPDDTTPRLASTEDQLVFGTGRNAVYEDGTPYSTTGINPYAKLSMD